MIKKIIILVSLIILLASYVFSNISDEIEGLTVEAWFNFKEFSIPYEGFSILKADEDYSDFAVFIKNNEYYIFKDGKEYRTYFQIEKEGWHLLSLVFETNGNITVYYDNSIDGKVIRCKKYDFSEIKISPENLFKSTINNSFIFIHEIVMWDIEIPILYSQKSFVEVISKKPEIVLEYPKNNQKFDKNIIKIKGKVKDYYRNTIDMYLNGLHRVIPLKNGKFNYEFILKDGKNTIKIRAKTFQAESEKEINIYYEPPVSEEIWIELTWDKSKADIDLHVIEPDNNEIYYNNKQGIGILDRDDTDGYGPEHYTLLTNKKKKGIYKPFVVYYNDNGQREPIKCKLVILKRGKKIYEKEFYLKKRKEKFAPNIKIEIR
ncbi:hypothetical protein X275_05965 [Marinitoga sp. 1197]|uniref:YfaP family protein n=1 Tax=Marinitoga sp. 1197 TaxID=1428449 RepID=UPI0006412F6E|nr:hypothetical protein [Marinitoga sp. 1197]KLO22480.1 hypothetical protein X275_05965 [Marinitoga sp. 1197]